MKIKRRIGNRMTRRPMMNAILGGLLLSLGARGPAHAEPPPSAAELLRFADRARGGLDEGVTWTIDIEATQDGHKNSRAYMVKAKGNNALCEALAPPRNKGETLLFNDRTIWFVKPGLRKPVSISARQRL